MTDPHVTPMRDWSPDRPPSAWTLAVHDHRERDRLRREVLTRLATPLPADAEHLLCAAEASAAPWESLAWLRRWAQFGTNPVADVRRYTDHFLHVKEMVGPPLHIWLHIGLIGSWEPILRELLSILERTGLRAAAGIVHAGVVGPANVNLRWLPEWVRIERRDGKLELGENSTLEALWDWSKTGVTGSVLYCHTKGASHRESNVNVQLWRDYLIYFNLMRWRESVAALDEGYEACGVEWFANGLDEAWFKQTWNSPHLRGAGFAGNIFWATASYLASLPADKIKLSTERHESEWDYIGTGNPKVKVWCQSKKNLYVTPFPRTEYEVSAGDSRPLATERAGQGPP